MSGIISNLKWRYACKQFDPSRKLSEDQLNTVVDSLVLTASSYGAQPWKFLIVKNKELREQLVGASFGQKQVSEASDLIVMCRYADINEEFIDGYISNVCEVRGQQPEELTGFKNMLMKIVEKTDTQKAQWAKNQVYIALGNLLTTCAELRIDSCPMEGFLPSKVDEILNLESLGLKSVLLCPIGFRSDSDKYANIKKVRQPKENIVRIIE